MEFFYDEQAVANDDASDQQQHDEKTVKAFNKLEDEVNQGYEKTTKALKSIVQEGDGGVKINLPLDPHVSDKAQQYLQQLDANLHNVESLAQNYWAQVAKPSFWSSVTENLGDKFDKVVKLGNENISAGAGRAAELVNRNLVGGNRTEAELRSLSTDKKVYLDFKGKLDDDFDVDIRTEEIAKLIEQDRDLANLMNEIVPQNISYKTYWNVYFTERKRILDMEDKRKQILESTNVAKEEEDISWDDVEDEANDVEEPVIVKKEDIHSKEKIPNEEVLNQTEITDKAKTSPEETKNNGSDDEDDDWE